MIKKKSPYLFDRRCVQKNIRTGLVTKKDYDEYLKSLPDDHANFEELVIEDETDEVILDQLSSELDFSDESSDIVLDELDEPETSEVVN